MAALNGRHRKLRSFKESEFGTRKLVNASLDNDLFQMLSNLKESQSQSNRNLYESSVQISKEKVVDHRHKHFVIEPDTNSSVHKATKGYKTGFSSYEPSRVNTSSQVLEFVRQNKGAIQAQEAL